MKKHVLFVHGAGEGAYEADKKLAASLQHCLGAEYDVDCPAMLDEGNAPYEQWKHQIETELATLPEPVVLVGHSVGASIALKWLSEAGEQPIAGVFLLATPYWGGTGWRYEGYEELELPQGFAARLPKDASLFLYHSRDDEVVPFAHLALYAEQLPQATVREFDGRGHQFHDDLSEVAADIKGMELIVSARLSLGCARQTDQAGSSASSSKRADAMFTLEQINEIHDRLGSAESLAQYVQALNAIGVETYDSYLLDGHSEYFGKHGYRVISPAVHEVLTIADTSDREQFLKHLNLHNQGKTSYLEMSKGLAESGVEKWTVDTYNMTMTFYDTSNNEMLVETLS